MQETKIIRLPILDETEIHELATVIFSVTYRADLAEKTVDLVSVQSGNAIADRMLDGLKSLLAQRWVEENRADILADLQAAEADRHSQMVDYQVEDRVAARREQEARR